MAQRITWKKWLNFRQDDKKYGMIDENLVPYFSEKNRIMPNYQQLQIESYDSPELIVQKKRAVKKLQVLREQLSDIPTSQLNYNLLLATWNIREFDSGAYGDRIFEANFYIAEIISKFDIVAIQEVNRDLHGLKTVAHILGDDWKYIISDTTEGGRGNDERIAYIYNSRKVQFGGLAGELVVPPKEERVPDPNNPGKKITKYTSLDQLWRTPLIGGFSAGWAKFMLCNVHVKWGDSELSRKEEIDNLARFLKQRSTDPTAWARKLILLGDFNISSVESETYQMLKEADYVSPSSHANIKTTVGAKKSQYDRIFIKEREAGFEILQGGRVDMFKNVFKDDEEDLYKDLMKKQDGSPAKRYSHWRTHQLSDHEPLWVEFRIQYEAEFLEKIEKEHGKV
jgi:endonuclease/exonuclease/phosphatase family metal-dependent hydrolase